MQELQSVPKPSKQGSRFESPCISCARESALDPVRETTGSNSPNQTKPSAHIAPSILTAKETSSRKHDQNLSGLYF